MNPSEGAAYVTDCTNASRIMQRDDVPLLQKCASLLVPRRCSARYACDSTQHHSRPVLLDESYMNSDNEMYSSHGGGNAGVYVMNKKSTDVRHPMPVDAMVFTEEVPWSIDDGQFADIPSGLPNYTPYNQWWNVPAMNHKGSNFAFADGHAEFRKWQDSSTLAFQTQPSGAAPFPVTDDPSDFDGFKTTWRQRPSDAGNLMPEISGLHF